MEYIDYICKLNNHDDYLKMLDILESKCLYVEYVLVDGRKSVGLVDKFYTDIISKDKTREWWGPPGPVNCPLLCGIGLA